MFEAASHSSITVLLLLLSLAVGLWRLNIVGARWNWRNEVDVLAMGDEEFMAHPEWKENDLMVKPTLNSVGG